MRERQIRRLPVVDEDQRLIGILSVSDIARETDRLRASKSSKRPIKDGELIETLGCDFHREWERRRLARGVAAASTIQPSLLSLPVGREGEGKRQF